MIFRKAPVPDLTPYVLNTNFQKFSLPDHEEDFEEIRWLWQDEDKAKQHLMEWVQMKKLTSRLEGGKRVAEGAETNSFFNAVGRPAERTRVLEVVQSYQAKQGAYKAEVKKREDGQRIATPSFFLNTNSFIQENDEDSKTRVDLEQLDVFGVEDVTDVGGEPLFAAFTFEDWTLMSLRYELHLMAHAFSKDSTDPDRFLPEVPGGLGELSCFDGQLSPSSFLCRAPCSQAPSVAFADQTLLAACAGTLHNQSCEVSCLGGRIKTGDLACQDGVFSSASCMQLCTSPPIVEEEEVQPEKSTKKSKKKASEEEEIEPEKPPKKNKKKASEEEEAEPEKPTKKSKKKAAEEEEVEPKKPTKKSKKEAAEEEEVEPEKPTKKSKKKAAEEEEVEPEKPKKKSKKKAPEEEEEIEPEEPTKKSKKEAAEEKEAEPEKPTRKSKKKAAEEEEVEPTKPKKKSKKKAAEEAKGEGLS
eukprot:g27663.t1